MIQRAWDAGIRRIITIGTGSGPDDMGCGIPIAESYDWIYASVGIHPHDAAKAEDRHFDLMRKLAAHLSHGLPCCSRRLRVDQIAYRLCLGEVQPAVCESPKRKLAGISHPGVQSKANIDNLPQ